MTITFYTLSKRKNSTKQPAITGSDYTGTLTTASGIVNPSIIMDFGNTAPTCNYAYISEFGRYYWVNEITSIGGGLWRVDMSCDVLASFKSSIGNNTKYVLRSASNSDGTIVDMKYPTKTGYSVNPITFAPGWNGLGMGNYVVGVMSNSGGSFGSVEVFVLDGSEFSSLRGVLAPASYYSGITDSDLQNLAVAICNPMQYITFVKYYPFTIARSATNTTMYLGGVHLDNMHLITNLTKTGGNTFTLTAHPLAATRGVYMNTEPFTHRFLSWMPVGMVHIPALAAGAQSIAMQYEVDLMSGTGDLILNAGGNRIYETAFSCGVDVPVAQILSENPLKVISGAISLAGAAVSGMIGNIPGAISSGISGITDFAMSTVPEVTASKPGGGSLIVDPVMVIYEFFANVVDDDNPEFGRPLCKAVSISTLSGFVQCADPEVYAVGATAPELEEIGSYMTGGFFYE